MKLILNSSMMMILLLMTGCGTFGVKLSDKNITTCVLSKNISKDPSGPAGISDEFSLEDKICLYSSFSWDDIEKEGGPQFFEYKWYTGNKMVAKKTVNSYFKNAPQQIWHCYIASVFGVGKHHVELYSDENMIASKQFTIHHKVQNSSNSTVSEDPKKKEEGSGS